MVRFLNDKEKDTLIELLEPELQYDFSIAEPGFVKNKQGDFFRLSYRCWLILSHVISGPLSIQDAEELLNYESDLKSGQKEIILDQKAVEYIVNRINHVLRTMKSVHRISSANGSFSLF